MCWSDADIAVSCQTAVEGVLVNILSVITCCRCMQVQDMGGWLNPCHPLFRLVDWWSGGAYEAFLERMLLGVMLVRDVVEKSRWGCGCLSQKYARGRADRLLCPV